MGRKRIEFRPQPGPQEAFLSSPADWVIYGGAAGGGKTWSLLYEGLRHKDNPRFRALLLRRTYSQVANPGGLLDASRPLYGAAGASFTRSRMQWTFPSGAEVKFGHLQYEGDEENYQGAEIAYIGFDEATHFSETQVFYLSSRNRSLSGVRPYMRFTCNPDPESWLANFLGWWIGEDGFPVAERAGVIRWFTRRGGEVIWADDAETLKEKAGKDAGVLSCTFFPALVQDNAILMETNPDYLANLQALPPVEQQRLLYGNWLVRPAAGKIFNRAWFEIVDEAPLGGIDCRFYDFAGTARDWRNGDPDFTASVLMRYFGGVYYILDVQAEQIGPAAIEEAVRAATTQDLARVDGYDIRYILRWEEEPGSAGKRETWRMVSLFAGLDVQGIRPEGDKLLRARPLAVQAQAGNVKILRGAWNENFLTHMHHQPSWPHDDIMDAAAGAFKELVTASALSEDISGAFAWR